MKYRTDITKLRDFLERKLARLVEDRMPFEAEAKELRANFEPKIGKALDGVVTQVELQQSNTDESAILNSSPRISADRLRSGLFGGITNPSTKWFENTFDSIKLLERPDVKDWLTAVSDELRRVMSQNNSYSVLSRVFLGMPVFGQAAGLIVPDDETIARAVLVDEGAYWIGTNAAGRVDVLARAFVYDFDQVVAEFGERALEGDTDLEQERDKEKKTGARYKIWNMVYPSDGMIKDLSKGKSFYSVYWREGSKKGCVLAVRGFGYNPIFAPRWDELGCAYGYGPGHKALSDAKELQVLEEDSLKALAKMIDPPMSAPEYMADEVINAQPGGVTYRRDDVAGDRTPFIEPLSKMQLDVAMIEGKIREVEARIGRIFFEDLLAVLLNNQSRSRELTAQEVLEITKEKMILLGVVLTRMDRELLTPWVAAHYQILLSKGMIPIAPDVVKGYEVRVKFISIMHSQQAAATVMSSMMQFMSFVADAAQINQEVIDKIDVDQAADVVAAALVLPPDVVRSDEDVKKLRDVRAKAMQQARQQEMMLAGAAPIAQATKDLSETDMKRGGSALGAVMKGAGMK